MQEMSLNSLYSSPTQNIEIECSLLGAVLLDESVMNDVQYLTPADFSLEAHKLIWRGIKHQFTNERPIDYMTVAQLMIQYKRLSEIGGIEYLTGLATSCPSPRAASEYARIVRATAIKRKGAEVGSQLIDLANDTAISATDYLNQAQQLVQDIGDQQQDEIKHVSESRGEFFEYLESKETFIKTGFAAFDEWAGGYSRGNLKITAARPSVGKTAKALQETSYIAEQGIGSVLFWSQETKTKKLLMRMLSCRTGVNGNRMRNRTLEPHEMKKLNDDYDKLEKLPIYFYDARSITIDEIRATARKHQKNIGPIAMIVVDYLTLMNIPQIGGERWDQSVGRVTRNAKRIAEEMDCVFNMLAQLNRDGDGVEPTLRHLKDSGDIEQDADIVEFLWHDKDETIPDGKIVQSFIAKGRDIGVERFKYLFRGWVQRYESYSDNKRR